MYVWQLRILAFSLAAWCAIPLLAAAAVPDFERDVAPILIRHCLNCHNAADAKGGLILSRHEAALRGGDSEEPAIAPGDEDASYLLMRIHDGEMPPEDQGEPLADQEIAVLSAWIKAGAAWPEGRVLSEFEFTTKKRAGYDWWSFQPVKQPDVPKIENPWIRTPVDAFILKKLNEKRLEPSPEADRRTLLRRVKFDLVGLPPTPEETAAYVADQHADAYEKVVERLLASPHYGERWGRHWLDVAHYADTHGFERDFRRDHAWPYRDYVLDAFNQDKPYDQFLREQIAGDVLGPNEPEKIIATGFLGAGPWDVTGLMETKNPVLQREARANVLDDMVTTVIASSMGLTINCARCHNHKFDPISQREYYSLWAVFAGARRGDRKLPVDPARQELLARKEKIEAELQTLEGRPVDLADIAVGGSGFGSAKENHALDVRTGKLIQGKAGYLEAPPNKYVESELPLVDGAFIPDGGENGQDSVPITSTGLAVVGLTDTTGKTWDYIHRGPSNSQASSILEGVDYHSEGHTQLALHANKGITFDLAALRTATGYGRLRFRSVAGCGSGGYSDFWVYVDGNLKAQAKGITSASGGHAIDVILAPDDRFLTLIATDGGNDISHDQIFFGDPRLIHEPEAGEGLATGKQQRRQELADRLDAIKKKLSSPAETPESVYAIVPKEAPPIHLLARGNTEAPGDVVPPRGLSLVSHLSPELGDSSTPEGARRRALAEWIVDAGNPLTRRVMVNRIWHYHFGKGIVDTPSDFGFHGGRPSHPELLDWLAAEFLHRDWSIKEMHRLIVLSSTYRQASRHNPKAAAIDADNRLLWRMNRRRLEAEEVRDAILFVSGKLNLERGGPGYRDFEYIDRYAPIYKYIPADRPELWKRTIYRFTVRSVANPFLEVLDCPNPSNFAPVRNRTTTALQALSLLNNEFVLKQAGYFAERIEAEAGGDRDAEVRLAFQLAWQRDPSQQEKQLSRDLVQEHGLFQLCRVLLNGSELIYVD